MIQVPGKPRLTPFRMEWTVPVHGCALANDLELLEPNPQVTFWGGPVSLDWEAGGRTWNRAVPDSYLPDAEDLVKIGPWIVPQWSPSGEPEKTLYDPMRVRTLHRDFASMSESPDAVLAFASRFGMLGAIGCNALLESPPTWAVPKVPCYVESVEVWYQFRRDVEDAVSLWDQSKDEAKAKQAWKPIVAESIRIMRAKLAREGVGHVDFNEEGERYFRWALFAGRGTGRQSDYAMDHVEVGPEGPILRPSLQYATLARLKLEEQLNKMLATWVRPTIAVEPGSTVMLRPRNLLGAIYALLAEEIIGAARPLKKCPGCGKWFQPLDVRRKTCSDSCRQRVWRADPNNQIGKTNAQSSKRK